MAGGGGGEAAEAEAATPPTKTEGNELQAAQEKDLNWLQTVGSMVQTPSGRLYNLAFAGFAPPILAFANGERERRTRTRLRLCVLCQLADPAVLRRRRRV